jgi:hypothetical protein
MLVECFRLAAAYRFLPDDAPPGIVFDQVKEAAAIGGPHRIALPSLGSGQGRACAGLKVVDPDPLGRVALHDGEARFVRRKGQADIRARVADRADHVALAVVPPKTPDGNGGAASAPGDEPAVRGNVEGGIASERPRDSFSHKRRPVQQRAVERQAESLFSGSPEGAPPAPSSFPSPDDAQ